MATCRRTPRALVEDDGAPAPSLDHRRGPTQAATQEPPSRRRGAAEPEAPPKTVEELLAELDELVGLTDVKAEIHRQAAVLRVEGLRKKAGLEQRRRSPGT